MALKSFWEWTCKKRANAIAFGQADVVDLSASQVRLVGQRGVRTASSDPVELFALQVDLTRPAVQDARIREAISTAIDRASIADVCLAAAGCSGRWSVAELAFGIRVPFSHGTGSCPDKRVLTAIGRKVSRAAPLVLVYDSGDDEARAVAERVAVNLKEAGVGVQLLGADNGQRHKAFGWRHAGWCACESLRRIHLRRCQHCWIHSENPIPALDTPQQDYAAERAPIDAFRVIPLVHVTESYGLGPQVRDWMTPRWGGWRLEDVWLEPAPATGATTP